MEDALQLMYQLKIEELIKESDYLEDVVDIITELVISFASIKRIKINESIELLTKHIIRPLLYPEIERKMRKRKYANIIPRLTN
jgi:hypothetical protein